MISIKENIVKILVYFDIFQYPLTNNEIADFSSFPVTQSSIDTALNQMVEERSIFKIDKFYSLQNNPALAIKRIVGNRLAIDQMKTAAKAANILANFPYVRGLAISGSLSKNFADEKTDIDFFIITKANRLWIARTIMHLFKKLSFLFRRQHWFCMNYYVDEAMLEIPEKNIFTAMEIVTLIPMYGSESMEQFYNENNWTRAFFPLKISTTKYIVKNKRRFLKILIEKIFDNNSGNNIDNWLMQLTDRRWKKKTQQKKINERGVRMGMSVDKHFSKPDPKNFQDKIVQQYQNKLNDHLKNIRSTSETTYSMIFSAAK